MKSDSITPAPCVSVSTAVARAVTLRGRVNRGESLPSYLGMGAAAEGRAREMDQDLLMPLVSKLRLGHSRLVTAKKSKSKPKAPKLKKERPAKKTPIAEPKEKNRTISVRALRLRYGLQDPITSDSTIGEICAAYEEAQGDASGPGSASDRLGVSYKVLWGLVRSNEALQARVIEIRQRFGNVWAPDEEEAEPAE